MARPKKRSAEPTNQPSTNSFVEALSFLANITKPVGPPNETHVYLRGGFATASNGILSAGIKITEELFACPHNDLMIKALSKCGQNLSITQLDNQRLSIKSDKFKAIVPCLDSELLQFAMPDSPIGVINDEFKKAVATLDVIKSVGDRIYDNSILLNGSSVIATTGQILFEYWHGLQLPSGIAMPKEIIKPLSTINRTLTHYGNSLSSFTFWYGENAFIKTQLMAQHWPDVSRLLEGECNPFAVPTDFWEALAAVAPFSEDGSVYFNKEKLCSHNTEGVGATFDVSGLPSGPAYPAKQLVLLKDLADKIDFIVPMEGGYCLKFFGPKSRGIIAGRSK